MPDTTSTNPTNPNASDDAKGGKSRLIIVGALCAVIAGAGFVLGGRMLGGSEPAEAAVVEEPEPEVTTIVELDALNVNLAGSHYLRIAVALGIDEHEFVDEDAEAGGGGHGATEDEGPPIETAPARDLILSTFSGRSIEDLSSVEGRELARHDLHEGLENFYGEGIVAVLFTEFVMQ